MIKLFIYKNVLKLKTKNNYEINKKDIDVCKKYPIEEWTKIVSKYTSTPQLNYDIYKMINLYKLKQIKINRDKKPIYHNYDDLEIYNRYAAIDKFGIQSLKNKMKNLLQRQKKKKTRR